MIIKKLTTGMLGVNTYFLINEKIGQAVIIDGGEDFDAIMKTAKALNVEIKYLLLTHAHFDHDGNARKLQEAGVKVYISEKEKDKLLKNDPLLAKWNKQLETLTADYGFFDGEVLELCGIKIKALITAGHTDGSACFIVENNIFSGDTLFFESVGRTDFETGNFDDIVKSIKRLYSLQGDYNVYAGHGENTTLDHEREFNPYVRI